MLDWYTVGLPPADAFAAVPLAGAAAANPAAANAANPAKLPARPGAKKAGAVPHSSVQAVRIQQAQLHDAPAQQATT